MFASRMRSRRSTIPSHSWEERRWLISGSDIGVVVVVFTVRQPDSIYRIIRLRPSVIAWAKREAKRRGLGYQTVIDEVLLKATA